MSLAGPDDQDRRTRAAWEDASTKHVREYQELLAEARTGTSLLEAERRLLAPSLAGHPSVVHLQSGHGLDDVALVMNGARSVIGIDYSSVAVGAAQRRADELGARCRYLLGALPDVGLRSGCADLVYTGKGALPWIRDLSAWAAEIVRLLRPGGQLFVYEGHPMAPLWTWDPDVPRVRPDRGYFDRTFVNDSFPARGAVESQWTLGQIVTAVQRGGLRLLDLAEYSEPFWRWGGVEAAAWDGRLPNAFSLLAVRES